jgi:hypothetical protein
MPVTVRREKNALMIEVPLERPSPSKSGKTLVVASSHGVVTTEVTYRRKRIALVLNAFIYPDNQQKHRVNRGAE